MASKEEQRQILLNMLWRFTETALRMVIGFFVGLWLARYLGPEKFGRFNYLSSWVGIFEALAWLGVADTVMRDLVRHREDEGLILGSAIMIRLFGSFLAIAVMLVTAGPLGGINGDDFLLLMVLCIGIPFNHATAGIYLWFSSHTNIGPATLAKNLSLIIGAAMRVSVIFLDAGLIGLTAALSFEYIIWCILIYGAFFWNGQSIRTWRFNIRHAWQMVVTGFPILLSVLVASFNQKIDQIMLGRLLDMSAVGVFAGALRFSEIWWSFCPIIIQSLASRYIYDKDLGDKLPRNVARIVVGMAFVSLFPCILISVFGAEVIGVVLGKEYEGSISVLKIHIWTAVLIFIDAPVNQYLLATHRQSQLVVKSVVLLLTNFGLLLILIPRFGAQGAAMSTLISEASTILILPILYPPLRDVVSIYGRAFKEIAPVFFRVFHRVLTLMDRLTLACQKFLPMGKPKGSGKAHTTNASFKASFGRFLYILAIGLFGVVLGLLAATSDPVKIGLGFSLMFGSALLMMPELTIWLILFIGFLLGVLSASATFGKVTWGVSLLSMLLLIPSLLNILWSKERKAPGFLLLAIGFLVYSIVVSIIQCHSLMEFIAGFKRYFQSFGLMLALTMIVFLPQIFVRWHKFLVFAALLQFPFALYELLVLVPLRGGLSLSSETTDVVAGTFGANLEGGSPNSVMVTFLFIVMAFLVARWRAGLLNSKIFYILTFICLLPLGMGETKIVVVMLPMVGLILLKEDLMRDPLRYLPAIFVMALLTLLVGYVYVAVMLHTTLDDALLSILEYNTGKKSYSGREGELNRWTSITFWFQRQNWGDPVSLLFGNGLGSSYHADDANGVSGHVGMKYMHSTINLTSASTLLWDTGLIGFSMFTGIFIAAWGAAGRLFKSVSDPTAKADALAIKAAISLFLLSLIYSDMLVNLVSMELLYAIVLGYLGYLLNHHGVFNRRPYPVG